MDNCNIHHIAMHLHASWREMNELCQTVDLPWMRRIKTGCITKTSSSLLSIIKKTIQVFVDFLNIAIFKANSVLI